MQTFEVLAVVGFKTIQVVANDAAEAIRLAMSNEYEEDWEDAEMNWDYFQIETVFDEHGTEYPLD